MVRWLLLVKMNRRTCGRSSRFDINEIAHHRLAPVHYLRHVGLNVPTQQLAAAFYDTYGLSEDFSKARSRRMNVGGFASLCGVLFRASHMQ